MDVYLNGDMVPYDQACLAHDDAAIQHAVGLFETMSARQGRVFRLGPHVQRLIGSARELGLSRSLQETQLEEAVRQTLRHNHLREARVRLTVTPGRLSLLKQDADASDGPRPTVLAVAGEPVKYDPQYFERGITVTVVGQAANPFDPLAGHKTLSYWGRLRTLRQAASLGAGEAIWLTVTNHLAGGAISNLFLVRDNKILTPLARGEAVAGDYPAPVLPGITRAAVMELAGQQGIPVQQQPLSIHDLLDADEVFLTNSSWHLLPVTRVEKKPISDGQVGPVSRQLRAALLALIEQETSTAD